MKLWLLPLTAMVLAGCQGVKTSTDNTTVTRGARFDSEGKVTTAPEVSVPVWKSDGMKPKPVDITPVKSESK
jgi:hypothetical protein